MKLPWEREYSRRSCSIIDLVIAIGRNVRVGPWGFEVTHIYGSGGRMMHDASGFASPNEVRAAAEQWFESEGRQALMDRFLGWFDNPHETEPAFEPTWRYCPFCTDSLGRHGVDNPLVSVGLMVPGDVKSYFYRAHKPCYVKDGVRVSETETVFVDLIEQAAGMNVE